MRLALLAILVLCIFPAAASAANPVADMGVSVTDDTDPVSGGTDVVYTIVVTNNGPEAADATLANAVPAGTTFKSLDVPTGWSCTTPAPGSTGSVSCNTAGIASGDSTTFMLTVHVNPSIADGSVLSDTATVGTSATDSNQTNDSFTETTTIQNDADVSITKSGSPDVVPPLGVITYTIGVSNAGPADAANVMWDDPLPADTVFVSLSQDSGPTFTCSTPSSGSPGSVDCSITSLQAGSTASFTIQVLVSGSPSNAAITNTATVTSSTQDFSETPNNSATTTTYVSSVTDLSVTKSDSPDPVQAGNQITYTIDVKNNGATAAGNVVLTDDVPDGTSFSTISGGPEDCSAPDPGGGGTIECHIPSIGAGQTVTYTLKVTVLTTQDNGSTITNTASVDSSTNDDPNTGNNSATATTTVQASADLHATSSDSPDPVLAGNDITYTINIDNGGAASAHNVSLADTLPAGTTFVSLDAPGGFSCSTPAVGAGGSVSCTGGTVDLGGGLTFTLVVNVNSNVGAGTMLSNTATFSSTTPESNPGDESTTATTTVNTQADVEVSKSGPATVAPTQDVTYTIGVSNNGPSDAAIVSMSDTLPSGTSFKSLTQTAGPTFTCSGGSTVVCTIASLPAGAQASFTLVATVAANAPSSITNTAAVSTTTSESSTANNTDSATTDVVPQAELAVTKSDSPDPVSAGTDLTYTLGLANNGPNDATNVSLSDTLPAGTTFKSITAPSGFSCTTPGVGSGGNVSCTASSLANGGSVSFTLVVHVAADRPNGSTLSNTASATGDQTDPNSTNNSATSTTTVQTSADVAASASDSPDPVTAGTDLTYTLGVANNGPSDATKVSLTDDLPAGTTFASLSAPADASCSTPSAGSAGTVHCDVGSLASGASRTFTLTVHVRPDVANGSTLTNQLTSGHGEADGLTSNDVASTNTTVATSADLSASVSDSPDPVGAGGVVTYHMHIQNAGPSDASEPRLTVPIPAGTTLVGAGQTDGSAFHCTSDGATVTCAAASLATGGGAAIDMAVRTAASQSGQITASPRASSSTSDPDGSNDASSETTTITPAPTSVTIGRTVTKRRSGSITIAVGCQGVPGRTCPVTVVVTFGPPHDDLAPIASAKTIKTGRSRSTVWLIAPRSERRRIKRIDRLPVHIEVTNRNGSGATRDATIVGTTP